MKSYKDSSFHGRAGQAADAKKKALEQLRARPALSDEQAAARKVASNRRETAKADKSAAKQQAAKAAAIVASAAEAALPAPPTEAERKAARDARYAARKNRK